RISGTVQMKVKRAFILFGYDKPMKRSTRPYEEYNTSIFKSNLKYLIPSSRD
ncbi:hypothetical protein PFDG_05358, partial [Plasmodium falciparum Dd2]